MRKIKVLHINTLDSYGGAAQVANDLIANTDAANSLAVKYKLTDRKEVISLSRMNLLDLLFLVVDKIRSMMGIRTPIRVKLGIGIMFNGTYWKLKRLKEYQEADVVHLHNIHGAYFDLNALLKIAKEKKIVWTLHDMWIMTGGEAYTFDNENYKLGIAQTPFINYYPLSDPYFDLRSYYLKKKKSIYQTISGSMTVVPVSHWLEKNFKQSYVYNDQIQVKTIHNGINLGIFSNKSLRTWKKTRILFFNNDNPFKGSYLFTDILKSITSDFDLMLIGDKIDGVTPFRHYDFIESRSQLAEIYNETDILIFPSLAEAFGLTVCEAMICGACVIASDTGGIPEILTNEFGYLFKSGDSQDLLRVINESLQNLDDTRKKGLLSEKLVREKFDLKFCAREYEKLYGELMNESK